MSSYTGGWIWSQEYQRYYRHRRSTSGQQQYEWGPATTSSNTSIEREESEWSTIPRSAAGGPSQQDKGKERATHPDSGDGSDPHTPRQAIQPGGIILPTNPSYESTYPSASSGEGIVQCQGEVRKIKGPRPPVAPPPAWPPTTPVASRPDDNDLGREPTYDQPQVEVQYHPTHKRYFRQRWNETAAQWDTEWLPDDYVAGAGRGIPKDHSALQTSSPGRRGETVQGTYGSTSNVYYETLDNSYYVRSRGFFVVGRVFAILFTEPAGENSQRNPLAYRPDSSITTLNHFTSLYTQVRRFVVVRQAREFCYGCPIYTYNGRATTKPGVVPSEHGIIYSTGQQPQLLSGEHGIEKYSIGVDMPEGERVLDAASRVRYGIHHPIQYNVKVKDLGQVPASHVATLQRNWREESERNMAKLTYANEDDEDDEDDEDEEGDEEEEHEQYVMV